MRKAKIVLDALCAILFITSSILWFMRSETTNAAIYVVCAILWIILCVMEIKDKEE